MCMGQDPRQAKGEDAPAWIGTIGLIKFLNFNQSDALIEGVAITPEGVRDLEYEDPSLKIKAAFVGYSKIMDFEPPEWTPELEKLIETTIGKDHLKFCKKHDWRYKDMHPHNELNRSEGIRSAVRGLGRANFRYFDLIDSIPPERRGGSVAKLQLEDHIKNAIEVRSFLLE